MDDNLSELLNNDLNKGLKDQNSLLSNKIKDKDEIIKSLNERIDESDKFVKDLEEKYKNQIKTLEEIAEKGKNTDTLNDKIDLLESQLKIKEDTLWEIRQTYKDDPKLINILQRTDEKVDKYIKENKGDKVQGYKNLSNDIENQLRLEIEKLTFNYN